MRINCRQGKPHWPMVCLINNKTTTSYGQCHELPPAPPPTTLHAHPPTVDIANVSVSAVKQQMESGNFQLLVHFRRDCETQASGWGAGRGAHR